MGDSAGPEVEPTGATAARESCPSSGISGGVSVQVESVPVLSWALARSGVPVVPRLTLRCDGDPVRAARVRVTVQDAEGPLGPGIELRTDLEPGRSTVLTSIGLRLDPEALARVQTGRPGTVEVHVESDGRVLSRQSTPVHVLGAAQWLAAPAPLALEMLAAHVLPGDPAVAALVGAAADLLELRTGDPSVAGDRSGTERIDQTAAAIVEAMRRRGIRPEESPASWADTAQGVRTPGEVLEDRRGSCLDTVVVLAAAFEHAGIRPLLWLAAGDGAGRGHAFLGYWRTPRCAESTATTVVDGLVELVERGDIALVETTMLTTGAEPATFGDLHRTPHAAWLTGDLHRVLGATDVHRARLDGVRPLPALRGALTERNPPDQARPAAELTDLPPVPSPLWQDLDEHWDDFSANPLVAHLASAPDEPYADPVAQAAEPVPDDDPDPDTHLDDLAAQVPLPADSCQLRAIAAAAVGHTFVLAGPPGTGKSQTLTNLLTHAVADGKRVLFVSGNQAALDVVARRLDDVGMGPLTLDLHGTAGRPAAVRAQLRTALQATTGALDTARGSSGEEDAEDLRAARRTLADYARRLHEPNTAGLSLYSAATGALPAGSLAPTLPVPVRFVASTSVRTVGAIRRALAALPPLADATHPRPGHPWGFLDRPDVDRVAVAQAVVAVDRAVDRVVEQLPVDGALVEGALTAVLGAARTVQDLDVLTEVVTAQQDGPSVARSVLEESRSAQWQAAADAVAAEVTAFVVLPHRGLDVVVPVALDLPLADLRTAAEQAAASSRFGRRKRLTTVLDQVATVLRPGVRVEPAALPALVSDLLAAQTEAGELAARTADVPGLQVPPGWNPLTDPGLVDRQVDRLRRLGNAADAATGGFADDLRRFLAGGPTPDAAEVAAVIGLRDAVTALLPACSTSPQRLAAWSGDDGLLRRWTATRGERAIDTYGLPSLGHWLDLLRRLELLSAAGLTQARAALLAGAVPAAAAVTAFDRGLAEASLRERQRATGLGAEDGAAQQQAARRFTEASRAARARLIATVPAQVLRSRSLLTSAAADRIGALRRELDRDGGPDVRALLADSGDLVPAVLPCVLADPSSVARYLPPTAGLFDLVVFDEASQLPVADALGALGRATAAVVVGDTAQLPPPSPGTDHDVPGISLLDACLRAGVPRLELTWHYRSRDESLIAFSNAEYYGNRLCSFPSPVAGPALSLVRVPGTFHRSGMLPGTNPVEARAVVAEIRRRFDTSPSAPPSIAVVTLHAQQRSLIEALLRDCGDERLAEALDRSLYVGHVDDVQGIERDAVFLSLGCSAPGRGPVPLDFGPLGRAGGERRLNVAVTRARAQVVVFASFDPQQLRAEETSMTGVRQLRAYLDVAATGTDLVPRDGSCSSVPDRHREEIATALRNRGLLVRTDVGLTGFRVDLSVARPAAPDAPALAVLLDGPAWAGRATVTDRDGVPVDVLERVLRWPVVERVWLTSWLADRDEVVDRLVAAVQAAVQPAPAGPLPPLPAAPAAPSAVGEATQLPAVPAMAVTTALPGGSSSGNAARSPAAAPVRVSVRPAVAPAKLDGEQPFQPWTPEPAGEPGLLRRLSDPDVAGLVRRVLAAGVAAEGPIQRERLARLTAGAFGVVRVNAARRESILALLPDPPAEFHWPESLDPATWSGFRRQATSRERPLEHVSPAEIGNAMVALCGAGAGVTRDELFSRTLAVFGHRRRHPVLVPFLEVALAQAVRASRVTRQPAGLLISAA